MPDWVARLAMTVAAALLTTACSAAVPDRQGRAEVATNDSVIEALCSTRTAASDLEAARASFAAAHGPLHELAAELTEVDRQLTGRLHVAKQATEAALREEDAALIAARVDELTEVARQALHALGRETPKCAGTS